MTREFIYSKFRDFSEDLIIMASENGQDRAILIVGAGTFGLASAHRLSRAGYTNITVLDKDSQVPSRASAGFDLNKIVRAEYADPFYTPYTLVSH